MRKANIFMSLAVSFALLLAVFAPAAAQTPYPGTLPLPNGFRPEGIVMGEGTDFYVGSLANGAIYRGNLRTGEGSVFIDGEEGGVAVGLSYDNRSGYLYVAGGGTGTARVYDTATGDLVAAYTFTDPGSFINDVIVTRRAAYFTDSTAARLFVVPLSAEGEPAGQGDVIELPLSGDWEQVQGFNANGIEAAANGKVLIVVNSTVGALYRVDPRTGVATRIDLGGASVSQGDGLLLLGKMLYVVRNRMNQIAVIRLSPNFLSGEVVRTITDPNFDVPTTIDNLGRRLYAVNARFNTPPGPDVQYWVTQVAR